MTCAVLFQACCCLAQENKNRWVYDKDCLEGINFICVYLLKTGFLGVRGKQTRPDGGGGGGREESCSEGVTQHSLPLYYVHHSPTQNIQCVTIQNEPLWSLDSLRYRQNCRGLYCKQTSWPEAQTRQVKGSHF